MKPELPAMKSNLKMK